MKIITCKDNTCVVNVRIAWHVTNLANLGKRNCYTYLGILCKTETKRGNLHILQEIRTVFYFLRGRASWIQSEIDIISKIYILSIN